MMLPLPQRLPAVRLRGAREDHAICLRLAASCRLRISRGEPALREQHGWAIAHCRTLRAGFSDPSEPRAPPV
ncbi:hypothetical protein [Methylobacterium oxalidis]|uniref:Uncharacterized protein n=1 Tax=Methylobacterium oxalidis TaxID=944322 RepID=A0A512J4E0_9HYPH|nr:hypothetical protein [Methylobacterium oxalidis]GEP04821.1 hypothetical protein MOX02_28590 [Methylobacterium oxalidis]GJE30518.1 hypothetical protein LDDCCGHA_0686 [Methylobacterium oxalidis]GLS63646.1 hypothetical protein GCM10007888_20270 [Methylobacterium oxalidis]